MKNLASVLMVTSIVVFSACTKTAKVTPSSKNIFSATINGKIEDFTIKDTVRTIGSSSLYISGSNQESKDRIYFFADTSAGSKSGSIDLLFEEGVDPGVHGYDGYYYTYGNFQNVNYTGTASFTTLTDTLISGTFSGYLVSENSVAGFSGLTTKTITHGTFSLHLGSVVLIRQ